MSTNFKSNFFWLKNKLLRPKAYQEYLNALAVENTTSENLSQINWEKRKKLVAYAYENIPFYKFFYDEQHFHPSHLIAEKDWALVPVVEKKLIREHKNSFLLPNVSSKKLINVTTGGSTGEPLKTFRDKGFSEEIIKWRMLKRWGISPSDDMLLLWRIPKAHTSLKYKIINELVWWPTTRLKYDSSVLSSDTLRKIYEDLVKIKPKIIYGYVGAVEQLALYLDKNNLKINYEPLVWVTAAPVSNVQKGIFKNVFGNKILDQYACSEIHWVASNPLNEDNLLIDWDYRHVDIVNQDNQAAAIGVEGDILLTDLENHVFPLIKYRVGDRSMFVNNHSESPFPMIAPVKGRTSDFTITPSGIVIAGEYLTTIFDEYTDYILQFQVHQLVDYTIDIKVVVRNQDDQTAKMVDEVISLLKMKTNNEVAIKLFYVDYIPHDRGKIRYIKCDVKR